MTKRNQCMIFLVTLCAAVASVYAAITHSFPEPVYFIMYYAFLSVSYAKNVYDGKFLWKKVHKDKGNRHKREDNLEARAWRVYRNCGIMLSISSIALGGAVIMLVKMEKQIKKLTLSAMFTASGIVLPMITGNIAAFCINTDEEFNI